VTEKPSIPALLPSSFSPRKTLVLDLDETLVHSTVKRNVKFDYNVEIYLEPAGFCSFYVLKRPHVDVFLKEVSVWFDVIFFTASLKEYADPVLNRLDNRNIAKRRLFRESCLNKDGNFIKDLGRIGMNLASTIIIDNSPIAYSHNKVNAIPIDSWFGDDIKDRSLINLLPFLNSLRSVNDVRSILSMRINTQMR